MTEPYTWTESKFVSGRGEITTTYGKCEDHLVFEILTETFPRGPNINHPDALGRWNAHLAWHERLEAKKNAPPQRAAPLDEIPSRLKKAAAFFKVAQNAQARGDGRRTVNKYLAYTLEVLSRYQLSQGIDQIGALLEALKPKPQTSQPEAAEQ